MKSLIIKGTIALILVVVLRLPLPEPPPVTPTPTPSAPVSPQPQPVKEMVEVLPSEAIALDMKYASTDNFLGRKVYDSARCFLRPGTAEKLKKTAAIAQSKGYQLKIFDCYRPLSVQKKMWEIMPDPNYVAPPDKGGRHNRGSAIDLTLMQNGKEVGMGSKFDEFSERSHTDYPSLSEQVRSDRLVLQGIMQGFTVLQSEWWHFDDADWRQYEVSDAPI